MNQKLNVFAPFAQRRNFNGKHPQPIEKVFAKLIVTDHAFQIPMCGGNQTNINVNGLGTSEAFELLFLQGPQKLGLNTSYVADLVEKQSAMIRQLKSASLLDQRPGESTLFVAEDSLSTKPEGIAAQFRRTNVRRPPRAEL